MIELMNNSNKSHIFNLDTFKILSTQVIEILKEKEKDLMRRVKLLKKNRKKNSIKLNKSSISSRSIANIQKIVSCGKGMIFFGKTHLPSSHAYHHQFGPL